MPLLYCVNGKVLAFYDQDQGVPADEYGPDCVIIPWANIRTLQKVGPAPKRGYDSRPYAAPVLQGKDLIPYARFKQTRLANGGVTVDFGDSSQPRYLQLATDPASLAMLHAVFLRVLADKTADKDKFDLVGRDHALHSLDARQVRAVSKAVSTFITQTNTTLARIIDAINQGFVENQAMVDNPPAPLPPWPANKIPT